MSNKQDLTIMEVMDAALDTIIDNADIEFVVRSSTRQLDLISNLLNAGYGVHDIFKAALFHYQLKKL